ALEVGLLEALELQRRLAERGREADVDLADLAAAAPALVADPGAHGRALVGGRHRQGGVVEARVRQPEAEREQRLDPLAVEPAVADLQALRVGGLAGDAGVLLLGAR